MSTFDVQFHSSPLRFFRFTPGLFVDFPGAGGVVRRGRVVRASDGIAQVMDERDGKLVSTSMPILPAAIS
jgi:hypothetical protein